MKKLILLSLVTLFAMNINTLSAQDNTTKKHTREMRREEHKIRRKAEKKAAETEKMRKEEHKREARKEALIRKEATQNSMSSVSNKEREK